MDIARDPAILRRRRLWRIAYTSLGAIAIVAASIAVAQMEPASPEVPIATLVLDEVRRGTIVRQVRGLGTLVPEDTRWIPATTDGRVERILLRPGATVGPNSVIVELSSPSVEQEALK
jgi:HlyD family secretion protein